MLILLYQKSRTAKIDMLKYIDMHALNLLIINNHTSNHWGCFCDALGW